MRVMRAVTFSAALASLVLCGCGTPAAVAPVSTYAARPGVHVWALDATGSITATSDGGASWTTRTVAAFSPDALYFALGFPDREHGWVVGSSGIILATKDGGATWQSQASGTKALLRDVSFADISHGCAVGVGGTILTTGDGGRTWVARDFSKSVYFRGVTCIDATHFLAVGDQGSDGTGLVYRSDDGGQNWRLVYRASAASFFAIAAPDQTHCWVVAEDSAMRTGLILGSHDGGAHWTTQHTSSPFDADATHPFFESVAFADAAHGWVVGPNNTILATSDGGASWAAQSAGLQGRYRDVACAGPLDAWLVGSQASNGVVGSTGGSSTWTLHHQQADAFVAVACQVEQ